MDEKGNNISSLTYFSFTNILVSILRGAPFFWRKDIQWKNIRVPSFPIFLSTISGILSHVPAFKKAYSQVVPPGLASQVIAFFFSSVIGALYIVFLNLITLFCIRYVIKKFSKVQYLDPNEHIFGARRVLYFSAFYQLLLFMTFIALEELSFYFHYDINYMRTEAIILILIGFVRLLSVFQGVRREVNGSVVAGLISIIPCFDVWFIYIGVLAYYSGI